jgi:hypothetical protein
MLFAVQSEVRGGLMRREATDRIFEHKWFDIQTEDKLPYPSQKHTSQEERWKTIIAWARKDSVERGWMEPNQHNNWDLTMAGLNWFRIVEDACRDTRLDVRRCYLWSRHFKLRMDPRYTFGQPERKRPANLYEGDWFQRAARQLLA